MKKILPVLILILLCCNFCMAEETINQPSATSASKNGTSDSTEKKTQETLSTQTQEPAPAAIPTQKLNNVFINTTIPDEETTANEEEAVELRGYVEYEDEPQETIFLEDQGETPQNTIYIKTTGTSNNSLKLKAPERIDPQSLLTTVNKKQISLQKINRLNAASKFSEQEYDINPISSSYSGKSGNLTFGTTYDTSISSAQLNYSTGFFTRYDGKHFAVTSAYSKNTNNGYDSYNDKIYFAPELKLTKRLSILDTMQTDIAQVKKQNEVVLRYKPSIGTHKDDIQLELGASQSFYENQYVNSSVRFSTRFKL